MQTTTNYALKKPEATDYYNIEDFNENAEVIDAKLKELEDGKAEVEHEHEEYATVESPVFTGSISLGRKAGTMVGFSSIAVGSAVEASGVFSHAEGSSTTASGENSHVEGWYSVAAGNYSHAEGTTSYANGNCSHAEGACTIASGYYQHAQGKFNVEDTENKYAHIVGGGTSNAERKNIHTVDWDGNAVYAGDVIATNTDGQQISIANSFLVETKKVYVSNSGSDTTGDGTEANPWKTIQHAVDMCPSVNEQEAYWSINLAEGTYDEDVNISFKEVMIQIQGASTLEESDNYKVRSITVSYMSNCLVSGVFFSGKTYEYSDVGFNVMYGSSANVTNCKFDDCRCISGIGSYISLIACDASNYQSGSISYGIIHASGGIIKCYQVTGSNNKAGYAAGVGSGVGGDIYINSSCTLTATVLIVENYGGKVHLGESNWQMLGSVTGTTSIAINSDLHTEFKITVYIQNLGACTFYITSTELTNAAATYASGAFSTSATNGAAAIKASKTAINLATAYYAGTNNASNAVMKVYGKRG